MSTLHRHTTPNATPNRVFTLQKYEDNENKHRIFRDLCGKNGLFLHFSAFFVKFRAFFVPNLHPKDESNGYTKGLMTERTPRKPQKGTKPPLLLGWSARTVKYFLPGFYGDGDVGSTLYL